MYATTLKAWFSVRGATTAIFPRPHQSQQFAIGQDRSLPGRSPKCPEWPVRPKPAIHGASLERQLSPKACHSSAALGRSRTDESVCPELESVRRALSVHEWVSALKVGHSQIRIMVLPIRRNRVLQRSNPVPATTITDSTSRRPLGRRCRLWPRPAGPILWRPPPPPGRRVRRGRSSRFR